MAQPAARYEEASSLNPAMPTRRIRGQTLRTTQELELVIGYRKEGNAASARCSLCGLWMPEDYASDAQGPEFIARFMEHFKTHAREKHGPRYVN